MACCMNDILEFVKLKTGAEKVSEESDIENDLRCAGDDFNELMAEYSKTFNVDMNSYLWYFHHDEETYSLIGGLFFKAPNRRVNRIAVTPKMLFDYVQKGKWDLGYPEHSIPKRRYDQLINATIIFLILVFLLYRCLKSVK